MESLHCGCSYSVGTQTRSLVCPIGQIMELMFRLEVVFGHVSILIG